MLTHNLEVYAEILIAPEGSQSYISSPGSVKELHTLSHSRSHSGSQIQRPAGWVCKSHQHHLKDKVQYTLPHPEMVKVNSINQSHRPKRFHTIYSQPCHGGLKVHSPHTGKWARLCPTPICPVAYPRTPGLTHQSRRGTCNAHFSQCQTHT